MTANISCGHDGAAILANFLTSTPAVNGPTGMSEAKRFKDWTFSVAVTSGSTWSAGTVTVQGSLDGGLTFFDLVPDAVNTSSGVNTNPFAAGITDAEIRYKGSLTCVRGVASANFAVSAGGAVTLKGYAVP
jgi:hypothetical protein